ncbi:MAG: hypothetical protein KTR31_12420 [Myxococcales bacterium]|nr:hypothetical protein [Myxococcales bacterium]
MIRSFPLLAIPMFVYNLVAWGDLLGAGDQEACAAQVGRPVHALTCQLDTSLLEIPMASRVVGSLDSVERVYWSVTAGDLLLLFALFMLFLEVLKSTGAGSGSVTNHALSLVVFVVGLVQFLMMPPFATSVYFMILSMALLDVVAGVIVTISAVRRDVSFN